MYCSIADVKDYVLDKYLDAMEEQNSGVLDRMLESVSGEIDEAIQFRYNLPLSVIPQQLKRIAAVITAYRVIGAITSVVSSESSVENEFLYLQQMYKSAEKELNDIKNKCADGLDPLHLDEDIEKLEVYSCARTFTDQMLSMF